MTNLSILKNYGAGFGGALALIVFTDRLGNPAAIDTSSKPVRIELEDAALAETRGAFLNIQPTGNKGEFSFDFETRAPGGITGAIVADADMTPEGEKELRVPFALMILEGEASGVAMRFGDGADKAAPSA